MCYIYNLVNRRSGKCTKPRYTYLHFLHPDEALTPSKESHPGNHVHESRGAVKLIGAISIYVRVRLYASGLSEAGIPSIADCILVCLDFNIIYATAETTKANKAIPKNEICKP